MATPTSDEGKSAAQAFRNDPLSAEGMSALVWGLGEAIANPAIHPNGQPLTFLERHQMQRETSTRATVYALGVGLQTSRYLTGAPNVSAGDVEAETWQNALAFGGIALHVFTRLSAMAGVLREARATVGATESYYRTMSAEHAGQLAATGRLSASGETFLSPTQAFSEAYEGVLVRLKVRGGTMESLVQLGVRDTSRATSAAYPAMSPVSKGWTSTSAFFKGEGGQINIGLGQGVARDLFNENLISYEILRF